MEGFEPVELSWKGGTYQVPADRVMGLVLAVETALTAGGQHQAMSILFRVEGPPHGALAAAYGAALRYAGAKVSDAQVYLTFQTALAEGKSAQIEMVQGATLGLIAIMSPPMGKVLAMANDIPDGDAKKKKAKAKD